MSLISPAGATLFRVYFSRKIVNPKSPHTRALLHQDAVLSRVDFSSNSRGGFHSINSTELIDSGPFQQ